MRIKKYFLLSTICILISIMSACSYKGVFGYKDRSIQNTINFLTSDKCEGRLPGSKGIKEAEKYITDSFEQFGLEKYNDSYAFEYKHKLWDTSKKEYKLSLYSGNETPIEFEYGKDFIENFMMNIDIRYKITFDLKEDNLANCIVVIDDWRNIKDVINNSKAILVRTENFKITAAKYSEKGTQILQISPETYNILKKNPSAELSIKSNIVAIEKEVSQNNLIGVLRGENHEGAIVLSAHFDSFGRNYGEIWRGAVDNASGMAVLLDMAQKLKQYSKNNLLKQDIIFCAFNGEESNLQGSLAFVKAVKKKYKSVYNINIDCVGIKNGGSLIITGENEQSKELMNTLYDLFSKSNLKVKTSNKQSGSDHKAFIENDIPAILISQEGFEEIIHTLNGEEASNIDCGYLEKTSKIITEFISAKSNMIFQTFTEENNNSISSKMEIINKEKNLLNYNEYKYIKFNNKTLIVNKNSKSFSEFNNEISGELIKIYPKLFIPKKIGEYEIKDVDVLDISSEKVVNPEIGKVYSRKSIPQNIGRLGLYYYMGKINNESYNEIVINIDGISKDDYRYAPYKGKEVGFNEILGNNYDLHINTEEINVGKEKYHIIYGKDNKIRGLYRSEKSGDKKFHIFIFALNTKWKYETVEDTINIYEALNLKDLIENNIGYIK